jgi:hypothetical protein
VINRQAPATESGDSAIEAEGSILRDRTAALDYLRVEDLPVFGWTAIGMD